LFLPSFFLLVKAASLGALPPYASLTGYSLRACVFFLLEGTNDLPLLSGSFLPLFSRGVCPALKEEVWLIVSITIINTFFIVSPKFI